MDPADITALTGAFDTSTLVTVFVGLAVFILGGLATVVAVNIVKGVIRKVSGKLSRGV